MSLFNLVVWKEVLYTKKISPTAYYKGYGYLEGGSCGCLYVGVYLARVYVCTDFVVAKRWQNDNPGRGPLFPLV